MTTHLFFLTPSAGSVPVGRTCAVHSQASECGKKLAHVVQECTTLRFSGTVPTRRVCQAQQQSRLCGSKREANTSSLQSLFLQGFGRQAHRGRHPRYRIVAPPIAAKLTLASGVQDFYTDPQIHTLKPGEYGGSSLGPPGIRGFFSSHVCNGICHLLGLPNYRPAAYQIPGPVGI